MAITVKLQNNASEKTKLTKNVTDIVSFSGTLKNEVSIVDPVILLEGDITAYANVNYFTIETFGRSYFLTGLRSIRTGLFEIAGHCDVLSSFATQIRAQTAIVSKQENQWNLYLNDGSFSIYQNPIISTHKFTGGDTDGLKNDFFVLAVAGDHGSAPPSTGGGDAE